MKQRILLFTLSLGIGYLAFSSYMTGAAANSQGDRTGRLSSSLTCAAAGCHSASAGATTCSIEIRKKSAGGTGATVTQYIQDTLYTVAIKGKHATLTHYGFQLTAVTGTGAAGTFSNIPSSAHSFTVSGVPVIEQSSTLMQSASGNDSISFDWKAPANTSVTFYGIINAVNNNTNEGGDAVSAPVNVTLQNAASVGNIDDNIVFTAYPNPFSTSLKLKMEHAQAGVYTVNVYDLRGKKISDGQITVNNTMSDYSVNTERWATGYYVIQIQKDGYSKMIPVIKK